MIVELNEIHINKLKRPSTINQHYKISLRWIYEAIHNTKHALKGVDIDGVWFIVDEGNLNEIIPDTTRRGRPRRPVESIEE